MMICLLSVCSFYNNRNVNIYLPEKKDKGPKTRIRIDTKTSFRVSSNSSLCKFKLFMAEKTQLFGVELMF